MASAGVTEFKAKVTWRNLAELTPYDRNAKQRPKEQVDAIGRSIQDFGFDQPMLGGRK